MMTGAGQRVDDDSDKRDDKMCGAIQKLDFFFFLGLPLFVSSSSCRLLLLLVASLEGQNAEMGKGDLTNERVRWSQRVREREIVR